MDWLERRCSFFPSFLPAMALVLRADILFSPSFQEMGISSRSSLWADVVARARPMTPFPLSKEDCNKKPFRFLLPVPEKCFPREETFGALLCLSLIEPFPEKREISFLERLLVSGSVFKCDVLSPRHVPAAVVPSLSPCRHRRAFFRSVTTRLPPFFEKRGFCQWSKSFWYLFFPRNEVPISQTKFKPPVGSKALFSPSPHSGSGICRGISKKEHGIPFHSCVSRSSSLTRRSAVRRRRSNSPLSLKGTFPPAASLTWPPPSKFDRWI